MSEQPAPNEVRGPDSGPRPPPRRGMAARVHALDPRSRRGRIVFAVAIWYLLSFVVLRDGIRYAVLSRELAHVHKYYASICYLRVEKERDPSSLLLEALGGREVPVERGSKMPPLTAEDDYAVWTPTGEPGIIQSVDRILPILPFLAIVDTCGFSAGLAAHWDQHIVVGVAPFWVVVHTRVLAVS